jgi:hypothetical protein
MKKNQRLTQIKLIKIFKINLICLDCFILGNFTETETRKLFNLNNKNN